MPVAERQQETESAASLLQRWARITGRIPAICRPQSLGVADVGQVSLWRETVVTSVLAGKLDTRAVNGPQDGDLDWDTISWRSVEDDVRRLRQRIFKASQDEDLARVRDLQKLMLRSWSNTLLSVRRVAQTNAGRKTAGIDGEVALTSAAKAALAVQLHRDTSNSSARYVPPARCTSPTTWLSWPGSLSRSSSC